MSNLKNARGWNMHHHELRPLLGLRPGFHLPASGLPAQDIDGTTVYVKPANVGGSRKHRVMAICHCGKHVAAGRLGQHQLGHARQVNRDEAQGRDIRDAETNT